MGACFSLGSVVKLPVEGLFRIWAFLVPNGVLDPNNITLISRANVTTPNTNTSNPFLCPFNDTNANATT